MRYSKLLLSVIAIASAFAGCSPSRTRQHNADSKHYSLSSPLMQLSSDCEVLIRTANPPANIPDAEFLKLATAHDPGLLDLFKGHRLLVQRGNPSAGVLVCEMRDGKEYAVQEDYSCTPELDKQSWKITPNSPCQFSTLIEQACAKATK